MLLPKKIASDIENNTENDLIDNNFGAWWRWPQKSYNAARKGQKYLW